VRKKSANLNRFLTHHADAALHGLRADYYDRDKIIIALRFLSAVDPKIVFSFLKIASHFLKESDLLVFNYSLDNPSVEKVGRNPRYQLTVEDEVRVLRSNGVLPQSFFTESQISELMTRYNFMVLTEEHPELLAHIPRLRGFAPPQGCSNL